jgi:hydroxyacylglutathione hydrolase
MSVQIYRIPALRDNYIFLLYDRQHRQAAVVDPAEPWPVLAQLKTLRAQLVAIFNTHHHGDHVGANLDLLAAFPQAVVYGGAGDRGRIPGQQVYLEDGDSVEFAGHTAQVLFLPGHTRAHIAYYFAPSNLLETGHPGQPATPSNPAPLGSAGDLFCGDVLFSAGCGRLFEGTPAQMLQSLNRIRQLPPTTRIWCAHEYTQTNIRFALSVDPHNVNLQAQAQWVDQCRRGHQPTIPAILGVEQQVNPFLRWDDPALQQAMATEDPVETFSRLRQKRNDF